MTASPRSARFDLSTICQLKCPSCPTASGQIGEQLGSGFASAEAFGRFLKENPQIAHVELSNWGEVLLNPEFSAITALAQRRHVALTIGNGVNLNTVRPETLEALVRHRVRLVTCSIDGASQDTYALYRRGGNFNTVIANLERINALKRQFNSRFPILLWQFVVFEHNRHELEQARAMARELGMEFFAKLSWDAELAPRPRADETTPATVQAFEEQHGTSYQQSLICRQLFSSPQVNWDGRLLGCCVNSWGDYGSLQQAPLQQLWRSERLAYARAMLRGEAPPRSDIPCSQCHTYGKMQARQRFLKASECRDPLLMALGLRFGRLGIALVDRLPLAERWMVAAIRQVIRNLD